MLLCPIRRARRRAWRTAPLLTSSRSCVQRVRGGSSFTPSARCRRSRSAWQSLRWSCRALRPCPCQTVRQSPCLRSMRRCAPTIALTRRLRRWTAGVRACLLCLQGRMLLTIVELLADVAARMRTALTDVLGDNDVLCRHACSLLAASHPVAVALAAIMVPVESVSDQPWRLNPFGYLRDGPQLRPLQEYDCAPDGSTVPTAVDVPHACWAPRATGAPPRDRAFALRGLPTSLRSFCPVAHYLLPLSASPCGHDPLSDFARL